MDKQLEERPGRVTISCLVSELVFSWRLREAGTGTAIDLVVELPVA